MEDTIVVASKKPAATVDDELSDEQIEQLLARATARLQEKSKQKQLIQKTDSHNFNFPKLDAGALEKPYVTTKGDIATVDSSRLLQEKLRRQAEGIRKVEDPVTSKKALAEVCLTSSFFIALSMRKIIPNFHLEQSSGSVLVAFLHY
jgi:phage FluMu protein gp41